VARANGLDHLVFTTGGRSEKFAQQILGLPIEAYVQMGDFVGFSHFVSVGSMVDVDWGTVADRILSPEIIGGRGAIGGGRDARIEPIAAMPAGSESRSARTMGRGTASGGETTPGPRLLAAAEMAPTATA